MGDIAAKVGVPCPVVLCALLSRFPTWNVTVRLVGSLLRFMPMCQAGGRQHVRSRWALRYVAEKDMHLSSFPLSSDDCPYGVSSRTHPSVVQAVHDMM